AAFALTAGGCEGAGERYGDLLDRDAGSARFDEGGVGVAAVGCLADGADVDDARAAYRAIEGDVAAPADDDVGRVVAEQNGDFLIVELVRERFERIAGGAVDELQMPRALDGDAHGSRELGKPRQDELAELVSRFPQALQSVALEIA